MTEKTALQKLAVSSPEFIGAVSAVEQFAMALLRQDEPDRPWPAVGLDLRARYRNLAAMLLLEHKDQL